jgi:hypothetical protein
MKTFTDYESMGRIHLLENVEPVVQEAYSGQSIVNWYGNIETQLQAKLDDQEASRNYENADRLRAFLNTWRENEITGSISIDSIEPLKAAAEQQASAKWNMRNYFSSLRNQLRKLVASEEELPRGTEGGLDPMSGGGGGSMGGAPPMSPDFGPEESAPGDLEGALGGEGMPPEGGPEGEPGAPAGEEGLPPEGGKPELKPGGKPKVTNKPL